MHEQPYSQPPKQGMSSGAKIGVGCGGCLVLAVILFAVVALGGFLSLGGDDGGGESTADDAGGDDGAEEESAAGIGDTVETDDFAYTVNDVEEGVTEVSDDSGFLTEEPQGQYVVIGLTVENVGTEAGLFDSSGQTLVDADGNQHSTDSAAEITSDAEAFLNEINPGNSVEGELIYDIPPDAEPVELELSGFLSLDAPVTVDLSG